MHLTNYFICLVYSRLRSNFIHSFQITYSYIKTTSYNVIHFKHSYIMYVYINIRSFVYLKYSSVTHKSFDVIHVITFTSVITGKYKRAHVHSSSNEMFMHICVVWSFNLNWILSITKMRPSRDAF